MKQRNGKFVGLLRGINVGGHNKIPMAELRALGDAAGWADVKSYIQSGNLVFSAAGKAPALEAELERLIQQRFGLSVPVLVRSVQQWSAFVDSNPFPNASAKEPNLVMLALSKAKPRADAATRLIERGADGERVEQFAQHLWIHLPAGAGRSKLTPAVFDRFAGSPVTLRNFRTVLRIAEMGS